MKNLVFLFSILLFISCTNEQSQTYKEMKSDKLLSASFTDNELENLAKIVDFFENQICDETIVIEKCLDEFLNRDFSKLKRGEFKGFINYSEQKALYKSFNSKFFNDFWKENETVFFDKNQNKINVNLYHLRNENNNSLSKYSFFIRELSKENSTILKYFESIKVLNNFNNPSSSIYLTHFHRKLDKKDIKIRLIYSLHFFNWNETSINPLKIINEIDSSIN